MLLLQQVAGASGSRTQGFLSSFSPRYPPRDGARPRRLGFGLGRGRKPRGSQAKGCSAKSRVQRDASEGA
eukprot:731801-Rhodomonas_salina.1